MKKKSFIILVILSLLFIGRGVNAITATSLCTYGTPINNPNFFNYCKHPHVTIAKNDLPIEYRHLKFKNDSEKTSTEINIYTAEILGKNQILFCLDPNLLPPTYEKSKYNKKYEYSRILYVAQPSSGKKFTNKKLDYDIALTKLYQLYIEDYLDLLSKGKEDDEAKYSNYQVALLTMRAITFKYGEDERSKNEGGADLNRINLYKGLYNQFDGKTTKNELEPISPKNDNQKYLEKAQKWYCQALLSCKTCSVVGERERNYCEGIIGEKKPKIYTFDIDIKSSTENVATTFTSTHFTKTIPFVVSGLNKFKIPSLKIPPSFSPSLKITGVKCDDKNLDCSLSNESLNNGNILSGANGDTYTFNVTITGKRSDFLNKKAVNVEVEFEKQHIMDPDNLAILQTEYNKVFYFQRMMVYMPSTPQKLSVSVSTSLPTSCEYELVDGKPKYTFDGKEVFVSEYLARGCCNVDIEKLTEEEIETYLNKCTANDMVKLVNECVNDNEGKFTKSFANQDDIADIMENVKAAENMYASDSYNEKDYKELLGNFANNIEQEYSTTGLSLGNDYCKMYTSERVNILLPGTVEATSGRYFIFKEGHQPLIEGKIYANFHTEVDRWLKDFNAAYETEKYRYNKWQDAIRVASEKAQEVAAEEARFKAAKAAKEEYVDKILEDAKAAKKIADEVEKSLNLEYKSAVRDRENLVKYKSECEKKTNIEKDWEYNLDPEVKFYYKQKINHLDENNLLTGKSEVVTEEVLMKPSNESDGKYWLGVSDAAPVLIENSKTGISSSATLSLAGYGGLVEGVTISYDKTSDYQIGYTQKLYYKPSIEYYSLLPSGQYVTSKESRTDINKLYIGYVFNTDVTNYEGEYETWFEIDNVGNLQKEGTPNIQKAINKYLLDNKDIFPDHEERKNGDIFANKCYYQNKEILYTRACLECDEPGADNELTSQIFYRTISIYNINPNNRENTNWTTEKGLAATEAIEELGDSIYDDYTQKYLEYSFTLTTADMAEIKKYNQDNLYNDFIGFVCIDGKECESGFVNTYSDNDITNKTRKTKWKYFNNGSFEEGSIETVLGGTYPSPSSDLTMWP